MDLNALMAGMGPIQDAMKRADAERAAARLEGSAGGGAVTVVLRGDLECERVTITPAAAAASEDDVSMLEDLVQAAVNDALKKHKQRFGASPDEQLQKSLAGSDLGGLLGGLMGGGGLS